MQQQHIATTTALIAVVAVCAFLIGLVINSAWLSVAAICVATVATIFAIAFYMQGR